MYSSKAGQSRIDASLKASLLRAVVERQRALPLQGQVREDAEQAWRHLTDDEDVEDRRAALHADRREEPVEEVNRAVDLSGAAVPV